MEPRKITVIQTKNQKKSVIITSASTLGELKDDLRTNGIDYNGMTFYEGLTKTELKTDESILPHDIERGGTITNELVFMLTNAEKKIKSGAMSRKEAYDYIKKNNLQNDVVKKLGRNFTMCKTDGLVSIVENHKGSNVKEKPVVKEKPEIKEQPVEESVTKENVTDNKAEAILKCYSPGLRSAFVKLLEILNENDVITDEETSMLLDEIDINDDSEFVKAVMQNATSYKPASDELESPYTQDEINQMFRGMK